MHAGHYISGAGHVGLIAWLLLGGLLTREPVPFEVTEVSVISGAEFEALMAAQRPPASVSEVAQPVAPDAPTAAPEVSATQDETITQPPPVQTESPASDPAPEVAEQALPPETQVDDTPPALEEPVGDVAVLVPDVAPTAVPRPVERIAPEPVAQPAPDATPDPVQEEAVSPEAGEEITEAEQQEATAPEEATTEIVTEVASAPRASIRPPGRRPAAPAPQPAAALAPTEPQEDVDAAAIAAAVAAAQA
ncbi:MAG: energy transducer TonB, partial [Sulfitobacter sp.]|nr:energy transducer TonB [Sulfitobacter sp.]